MSITSSFGHRGPSLPSSFSHSHSSYPQAAPAASQLPHPSFASHPRYSSASPATAAYGAVAPARAAMTQHEGLFAHGRGAPASVQHLPSPFHHQGRAPSSQGSDYDSDDASDYEEEESFDGPLKDQYRGRAWSGGMEDIEDAPCFTEYQREANRSSWSPEDRFDLPVEQRAQQHQQQSAPSRDLDRLFDGLRAPHAVGIHGQQQQYQPHVAAAASYEQHPVIQPAPVAPAPEPKASPASATSSLFLAPFAAGAVWSLLQQPFAFHAPAKKHSAIVAEDAPGARGAGEYGRDDWWPATPPNGPVLDYGQTKIGGAWEEDRWSRDSYGHRYSHSPPPLTLADFASPINRSAVPVLRFNPYDLTPEAPSTLSKFVHQTLAQTLLSPTGVLLALWYISRAPLHEGGGEDGRAFRAGLRKCGGGEEIAQRVLTLGLAWANKWLDDNTFTNRSWSDVTRIPIAEINQLEQHALAPISFDLSVSIDDWSAWLAFLYPATSDPDVRSALVEASRALTDAEHGRAQLVRYHDSELAQMGDYLGLSIAFPPAPVKQQQQPRQDWNGSTVSTARASMSSCASQMRSSSSWNEFGAPVPAPSFSSHSVAAAPVASQTYSTPPASVYPSYPSSSLRSSVRSSLSQHAPYPTASSSVRHHASHDRSGAGPRLSLPSVRQGFDSWRGGFALGGGPHMQACW